MRYQTATDLVGDIAKRVESLGQCRMQDLRDIVGTDDSQNSRNQECYGMSRGQLIADIILTEFDYIELE